MNEGSGTRSKRRRDETDQTQNSSGRKSCRLNTSTVDQQSHGTEIDANLNYVISNANNVPNGLNNEQAHALMESFEDQSIDYLYKRCYPLRHQKCVNTDCGVSSSYRFFAITDPNDSTRVKPICCCECKNYHQIHKSFPIKRHAKRCMAENCSGLTPTWVNVEDENGNLVGYLCKPCSNKPNAYHHLDKSNWTCENPFCNLPYAEDRQIHRTTWLFDIVYTKPITKICSKCHCYAKSHKFDHNGMTFYSLRPPLAKDIERECRLKKSIVCLRKYKTNELASDNLPACGNCRKYMKICFYKERTQKCIEYTMCSRCEKKSSTFIVVDEKLVCLDCASEGEWSTFLDKFGGSKIKIRNIEPDFANDSTPEMMLAECTKYFTIEKEKICMVYIYLNGNFEIKSLDDFKAAFMYVGKSNDFTPPKEAYLRHFAFNRVGYVNILKKITLVNCLNSNGDGKVIVFSAFVKLGLNESLFLESTLIDLVLSSNEFPEVTNMQVGKKVIIINNEQLKRKLQHHLVEKAYSQFISCRVSKENYCEVD